MSNVRVETIVSINDTEAEFWTCTTDKCENLSDSLYFKFHNQLDELEILFKQNLAKQVDEVVKEIEKKPTTTNFQFDDNIILNENIPGMNMSFLDRLIHQLTRPAIDENDEEFTEIDINEITSVVNESIDEKKYEIKEENSFTHSIRSFFEELYEETDVIFGKLRLDTLVRRRCQQAKSTDNKLSKQTPEIISYV